MTREERLELLKQIEKDIHVCSLVSTFIDDAKSCAIHSVIEELEQEPIRSAEITQYRHDCKKLMEENERLKKALEKQPCEDCISRKAVLDKIKEVCFSREQEWVDFRVSQGSNGQRDLIINFIEDLPSVQPKQKTAESDKCVHKDCYYNDGEVHAECVICDKTESEG